MDKKATVNADRLAEALRVSETKLGVFRGNRKAFLQQYIGRNYSSNGASDKVPVNLIELATQIYSRLLAARHPQVLVTTPHLPLKPDAAKLTLAMNHLFKEIDFGTILCRAVIESIFGYAVAKVGLDLEGRAGHSGTAHEAGRPYVDIIGLDDWVFDVGAKRWDQAQFMGHRFRVPLKNVRESTLYDKSVTKDLSPTEGEPAGGERNSSQELTAGKEALKDEYIPHIELWELWLPYDQLVVTAPTDDPAKILRVVEWRGPRGGPFRPLTFSDVPGNVLPLPPASLWYDLHTLANAIYRKIARQAERQKTIVGYMGGAETDAQRVKDASDGEMISMDNPDKVRELRFGGADPASTALALQVLDHFSYVAGNLNVMGGLGPEAATLGQERLLDEKSSERIKDMSERVLDFATGIMRDLAWWLYTDPFIQLPLTKRVEGTPIELPVTWGPENRKADFLAYNFEIQAYSMRNEAPAEKAQRLMMMLSQYVFPVLPILQQQGRILDVGAMVRMFRDYMNLPEIDDLLPFGGMIMPEQPKEVVGEQPLKADFTSREYIRRNIPGQTMAGKHDVMSRMLMAQAGGAGGPGVQRAERHSAMRPMGG